MAIVGIGIDLVDIAVAERLLARWGERVVRRTLTEAEAAYVTAASVPARHFAVRLAAKEAVYKALQSLPGARAIGWRQIEVERAESGHPSILLHGAAARLSKESGPLRLLISLSHSELSAGAVALVERE